ncbi:hypothetical protein JTB14_021969 [Gonioctena quinquepunctata]|nr:hypothetical protein JTB14_021969 [Gonioctena quinquepunctata]
MRDKRAKDLSIQSRPLPAMDFLSKLMAKALSDCAKNRLRFKHRVYKLSAWSAGDLKDEMMLLRNLPYYLRKLIIEKNAVGKEYQSTNDERKFIEFQIANEAIIAELRTLRDERAKDLSIQREPLPAPDFFSKLIAKGLSDCAKNRLRFKQRIQPWHGP